MKRIFVATPPVLPTESTEKFQALRADFRQDIKPRDAIEKMYCDDIACLVWETHRLRRIRDAALRTAMRAALYDLLVEKLGVMEGGEETVEYLDEWPSQEEVREQVSVWLRSYDLDESAIEAEAFGQSSSLFVQVEQLLSSAELRRDRALHNVAYYRHELAQQLRSKATSRMESEEVLQLEHKNRCSRG